MERYREEVRDARGLAWVGGLALDFRLGLRMLLKYPGLTLVGVVGMAVAIAIGAGFFAFLHAYVIPPLPLDEGERVVGIETRDAAANEPERRVLHDFAAWRGELESVQHLGAFRTLRRNLIASGGPAEPVHVAEMTASGFRVARVPPLLGRYLVEEDERPGAPPVVVVGYDAWRSRFAGDPAIVGREVRLGSAPHTVVGVMPEGFAFPINHRFWVPMRADPLAYGRRQGPEVQVFGRLAPGATPARAQAELAAAGRRTAAAFPETHAQLRPGIVPFTTVFGPVSGGSSRWALYLVQLVVSLLLVVVAANVAVLVYARTATRMGEITVRTALGASRRRIVSQLFLEALVLSAGAAAVGLLLARIVLGKLDAMLVNLAAQYGGLPFWMESGLPSSTVLYVLALTVVGAVIVGVVPALQATGRGMKSRLSQLGGGTGMHLGRTWTLLIVAQVTLAVAVLPTTFLLGWEWIRYGFVEPGFAAEEFLSARLEMDRETPPGAEADRYEREFSSRYGDRLAELVRRLEADPRVSGVTFASEIPGQESGATVEVAGESPAVPAARHEVRFNRVDAGFFDRFGVPVLAGRGFRQGDLGPAAAAVVVNRSFVRRFLGGGSALGRRVRYAAAEEGGEPGGAEPGRWYEIAGVVDDFPASAMYPGAVDARVYHPLAPGGLHPVSLAVRVRGTTPAAFAGPLRETAAAVDPALRPHEVSPLDEVYSGGEQALMRVGAWAMGLVILSVLLLSAAGIYALTSLAVTRRRREIGIRSALGADPRRILASVFSRTLGQLAAGVVLGTLAAASLAGSAEDGTALLPAVVPAVAALMAAVGLLAALGPARRSLRIEPMDALREE